MSSPHIPLSRRGFFGRMAAAPVATIAPTLEQPPRAWILVALGWEYNDEFNYPEGEYPETRLYCRRDEADAECRKRCVAFFADQTPAEFEVDFTNWLPDRVSDSDFDEDAVTWDELRTAGFPDPYYVLELTSPESESP